MNKKLSFPKVFIGTLFHPRETTRLVIDQNYNSFVFPLVLTSSFFSSCTPSTSALFFKYFPMKVIPFVSVVVGVGFGLVVFFGFARLITWMGKKFGGIGNLKEIQLAYALILVPTLFSFVLEIIIDIPAWQNFFSNPGHFDQPSIRDLFAQNPVLLPLSFVFHFWLIILWIINISEAHQYSKGQAFKTFLALGGLFFSVGLVLFFLVMFLIGLF